MGAELMLLGSIAQAGMSIMGGIQANKEAKSQANMALAQSAQAGVEQERQSWAQARQVQEEAKDTERKQKLAYLASGVSLSGSPLLMMEATRQKGIQNVNEVMTGGKAASNAAMTEGRMTAVKARSMGRQAFISGIGSGISSAASGIGTYKGY